MTQNEACKIFYLRQVADNPEIYRFKISSAAGNTYVISSENELLIIDPPIRSEEDCKIFSFAAKSMIETHTVIKLFFTHAHEMDFSLITQYFLSCSAVYIGKNENIPTEKENPLQYQNQKYLHEGYPKEVLAQWDAHTEVPLLEDECIEFTQVSEGDLIKLGNYRLQCIDTPGHTSGHMCLWLKEKGILFSGDMFLYEMLPCVGIWDETDNEIEIMLNSLARLKQYPIQKVFPSHGSDDGDFIKRLEEIERQFYVRILHMYRLVYDYPAKNAYDLCEYFYQNSNNWDEALPQKKWHAMGEALTFLNYLRNKKYVAVKQSKHGLVNIPGKNKLTDY